ncbi:MAG: ABC transporter substrate-binding protein [Neobacillus sp.]
MKKRIVLVVGFALLLVLVGIHVSSKISKTNTSNITVRIGYLRHPGYLPLFCADYLGVFEKEKVRINLVSFASSPAMVSAFESADIQVAPVATASALSLESLDPGKFKVFALSSETVDNYLTAIVSLPKNTPNINSISDLRGKTIALFPGPAARVLFSLVFKKYGLVPDRDIILKELTPPLQLQALSSGQVDALATYEPIATQAVIELGARIIMPAAVESNVLSPTQGGSWLISSSFLKKYPKVAKLIIDDINIGIDFIHQNRDSLPKIISKYALVSIGVAEKASIVTYSKRENIDIPSFQKHADLMYENGVISKRIDVSKLIIDMNELK